ncbi:MAG: class I SAM-dependent methyltransferase [Aigarchaeota archaeon]|nr:class I SAM-dependent methyltransferase [Aigarchaeota archaeon]MDW8092135.1 class I SAM-dependent methyltransferase [Nitrososphaerota archaeon]
MDWFDLERAIFSLGRNYRRVNRAISLGLDVKIRRTGIIRAGIGEVVLDVGAGDGSLTSEILTMSKSSFVVMLDPLRGMLELAIKTMSREEAARTCPIVGIAEYMPLRPNSVDGVFMAFSLRDVIDLNRCLSSIKATLRARGRLVVIDLGRPVSRLIFELTRIYWSRLAPVIATLRAGRPGRSVREILPSLDRLPTNPLMTGLLGEYFRLVWRKYYLFGAAQILVCQKESALDTDEPIGRSSFITIRDERVMTGP